MNENCRVVSNKRLIAFIVTFQSITLGDVSGHILEREEHLNFSLCVNKVFKMQLKDREGSGFQHVCKNSLPTTYLTTH